MNNMKKLIMITTASIISFGAYAEYSDDCILGLCETKEHSLVKTDTNQRSVGFYKKIPQNFYE